MGTLASRRRALYDQAHIVVKKGNLLARLPHVLVVPKKRYISSDVRVFAGEDAGVPVARLRSCDLAGGARLTWDAGVLTWERWRHAGEHSTTRHKSS